MKCVMGKKKKTYVKPEMKIIEVKTEGVIAASGGEIDIPAPDWENQIYCDNNMFSGSCGKYNGHSDVLAQKSECHLGGVGYYVSCLKYPLHIGDKVIPAGKVTLHKYINNKGEERISISSGWR